MAFYHRPSALPSRAAAPFTRGRPARATRSTHRERAGWYPPLVVLLAFDLDKTLITNDYVLPHETLEAVHAARRRGHVVTVLTGRPLRSARPFLEQLELSVPHAVNHGSLVRDAAGAPLRHMRLATRQVDDLLQDHLHDAEVEFSCVVGDVLYVRDPGSERWTWVHAESRTITAFRVGMGLDADKVVFHGQARSEAIDRRIAERHPDLLRYLWGDGFLEIVPPGGDKGTALEYIAGLLGFEREDVVAFGDGLNDVSMLHWAGHSVSVGPEAHPDALSAADEHVDSPEEGGVAAWLERHAI